MKELSIEEKALRYDEAIERAKNRYSTTDSSADIKLIGLIFPELKESEDKRIRKALVDTFKFYDSSMNSPYLVDISKKDILAWLEKQKIEKQGEKKSADKVEPKFKVGDEIKTANEESLTITKIDENGYWSEDLFICGFDEECIWDLVGQKHVDKVEPKFKVCDWVVRGDTIAQILDIQEQYYVGLDINGKDFTSSRFLNDDKIHLWSIQDAKAGDVLASDNGVCIFDGTLEEGKYPFAYCGITKRGFESYNGNLPFSHDNNIHPATKGQRDTLIKAMTDAGYTFDFEKKELKKIEQKPVECSEDNLSEFESYLCLMFQKFRTKEVCTNGEIIDYVKEHSQKLKDTLCHVWSEEDEKMYNVVHDLAWEAYKTSRRLDIPTFGIINDWLKSLRPQNTWKPSDEHYKLEEFAKIVRSNLTGISKAVQELFETKYLQLTGNKMYGGFKD